MTPRCAAAHACRSRPEPTGLAPPPSGRHCCAVVRGHMLLISGEEAWEGYVWALRYDSSPMMWLRSALADFPLLGVSRHTLVEFLTPRPHRRDELLIFGGVLESTYADSQVLNSFFTLDMRSWHETESDVPRETWLDVEKRLRADGRDDDEVANARGDWEEDQKRKQREIARANRRRRRRNLLSGGNSAGDSAVADDAEVSAGDDNDDEVDEETAARLAADVEFELPKERMPTISFGEWVPLRVGQQLPPPRFGHAMAMAGTTVYVFGGRDRSITAPVRNDFFSFEGAPLAWKAISFDGDGPGTRVSHAMVLLEHYLYVLGGGSGNRSFNDLHRLDLYTMHWELMHTRGELPGSKPDALIGHSMQWVDPYLVVFAGGDGRKPSNELHTLELSTGIWRKVETKGAPPAPRVGHSSTQLGADMCAHRHPCSLHAVACAARWRPPPHTSLPLPQVHHRRLFEGKVLS